MWGKSHYYRNSEDTYTVQWRAKLLEFDIRNQDLFKIIFKVLFFKNIVGYVDAMDAVDQSMKKSRNNSRRKSRGQSVPKVPFKTIIFKYVTPGSTTFLGAYFTTMKSKLRTIVSDARYNRGPFIKIYNDTKEEYTKILYPYNNPAYAIQLYRHRETVGKDIEDLVASQLRTSMYGSSIKPTDTKEVQPLGAKRSKKKRRKGRHKKSKRGFKARTKRHTRNRRKQKKK